MKSKRNKKRKRPATDREALWPDDPFTDKHNDRVIKQLATRNSSKEHKNV